MGGRIGLSILRLLLDEHFPIHVKLRFIILTNGNAVAWENVNCQRGKDIVCTKIKESKHLGYVYASVNTHRSSIWGGLIIYNN